MKGFGFWALLLMLGTALLCLSFFTKSITFPGPDTAITHYEHDDTVTSTSRKLKDNRHIRRSDKSDAGKVSLEDYSPVDPVPSSKASIHPGPIQHGTPLMPYIPKPSPPVPGHPKRGVP